MNKSVGFGELSEAACTLIMAAANLMLLRKVEGRDLVAETGFALGDGLNCSSTVN